MKRIFILLILAAAAVTGWADDLALLQGKWSVKKTGDRGSFTMKIEFKQSKWTFKIVNADDAVTFVASGDVELKKEGPFNAARFYNIKAGRAETEMEAVDDERRSIYLLDNGVFYLASNLDKVRQEKPSVDAYTKAN